MVGTKKSYFKLNFKGTKKSYFKLIFLTIRCEKMKAFTLEM